MSRMPRVSGREAAKALSKFGYLLDRQRGSHMVLIRESPRNRVVVPDHRELDKGTLAAILRQAGLDIESFREAL